jgi:hypothetical protein
MCAWLLCVVCLVVQVMQSPTGAIFVDGKGSKQLQHVSSGSEAAH